MCLDEEDPTGAAPTSTVLMRLIQEGDQAIFQTIESDDEFERVMAFIQETAREMDAADGT